MKRKLFLLSLLVVFSLVLGACAPAAVEPEVEEPEVEEPEVEEPEVEEPEVEEPEAEEPEVEEPEEVVEEGIAEEVIVAIGADPANLAPFVGMSMGRIAVLNSIYEYLIELPNKDGDWVPYLAYEIEEVDEKTFNVKLFDYIYDSAGNHITASDVAWSYNTAIELGNLRPLGDIEPVTVVDDYTAQFIFKNPLGVGTLNKVLTECPIVSQAAYEGSADEFATSPITTAPYVLSNYIPGSSLTFEKRDDYWQTDDSLVAVNSRANVKRFILQVITEPAQHAIALETGSAHISKSVTGADIARFQEGGESSEGFQVIKFLDNLTIAIEFNGAVGPFVDNEALRKAVAYAIDTTAACEAVKPGACRPAKTLGNPNFGGYITEWDEESYYDYDLEMAKDLLTDAGYEPGELNLKLTSQNSPEESLLTQVIQAQLGELGIGVEINQLEPTVYNEIVKDPEQVGEMWIQAAAGGDFVFSPWQLVLDQNRNNGTTGNFFKDDDLQALLNTVASLEGFTPENVDAVHEYLKDKLYVYGLLSYYNLAVADDGITYLHRDMRNEIIPGACEFAPDF